MFLLIWIDSKKVLRKGKPGRLLDRVEETVEHLRENGALAANAQPIVVDQDIAFLGDLIDTLYLFDHGRISRRIEKADMPTHEEIMKLMFGEDHH